MFCIIFGLFGIVAAIVLQLLAIPALDCEGYKMAFEGIVVALTVISVMLVKLALASALIMGV